MKTTLGATKLMSLFTLVFLVTNVAALDCPTPPQQTQKDWQVTVDAAVAKIGPLKGGDLQSKVQVVTQDLLGKLPDAGRIYLEQMMFAAYCTALRDDKTLPDSEKAVRLRQYSSEVRKTIDKTIPGSAQTPQGDHKPVAKGTKTSSAEHLAWKKAWINIREMMESLTLWGFKEQEIGADGYPAKYTDRKFLLNELGRLDLRFSRPLGSEKDQLADYIRGRPKANTLYTQMYPIPGMDVIWYDDRIKKMLRDLKTGIRDGAMEHGVDVEVQADKK